MAVWIPVLIVIVVALYMFMGSDAFAEIRVKDGRWKVSKGSFSKAFLQDVDHILQGTQGKGRIKVVNKQNRYQLECEGNISEGQEQQLRNIFPEDDHRQVCSALKKFE
ncbi:DUF3634 family protein [Aliidiomarina sp. Khilg15.8]